MAVAAPDLGFMAERMSVDALGRRPRGEQHMPSEMCGLCENVIFRSKNDPNFENYLVYVLRLLLMMLCTFCC